MEYFSGQEPSNFSCAEDYVSLPVIDEGSCTLSFPSDLVSNLSCVVDLKETDESFVRCYECERFGRYCLENCVVSCVLHKNMSSFF